MKTKQYTQLFLLLCVAVMSTGCASIVNSPIHSVRIDSTPQNAKFTVVDELGDEVAKGITPDSVQLHSSGAPFQAARYYISYDHEDYPGKTEVLKGYMSPWYVLNILFSVPGLLGAVVIDPFTGTMYQLPSESSSVLSNQPVTVGADDSEQANEQLDSVPEVAQ